MYGIDMEKYSMSSLKQETLVYQSNDYSTNDSNERWKRIESSEGNWKRGFKEFILPELVSCYPRPPPKNPWLRPCAYEDND